MTHELKIWPQYYCRVLDGSKTFEVRKNDRGFQSGDIVILREWDPTPVNATSDIPKGYVVDSKPLKFKIGYILENGTGHVIFSLLPIDKTKEPTRKKKQ